MRTYLKVAAGILANLAMFSNSVLAYLPPIDFESYGEGTPLNLSSPDVWENVIGNSVVSTAGEGFGGAGKAIKIVKNTQAEAWLRKPVEWNSADQIAFIDFRIKPAATTTGSQANFVANGTQLAFQLPTGSTTGQLWVLDGNDDATGTPPPAEKWYLSAGTYTIPTGAGTSATWLRATLRHDYQRKIWDLFIDGKLAAVNLGFEGRGTNLDSLEFFGSRSGDTLIDNLEANPSNMLFPDADKDGLPDAWETANGSNPNVYDRDSIKPGTGKSFLDNYLDSLWNAQTPGTPVNGTTNTGNVGTVPPLTILDLHQPVGAIKGQFAVGGDGAATYTIPLDIPKGRAGMEPKLSLNYSSNGSNGTMGVGWSLGGLQRITRGPSSLKKDGIADSADFDESDRYFLDGERLVCVSTGTGVTYGGAGTEYRTETDSYSRIMAYGQDGKGPLYWTVETKAGLKMTFGQTADARIRVPDFNGSGSGGASSWLVDLVEDTTGKNAYTVEYCSDTESRATASAATRYPARLYYTVDPSTLDTSTGRVPDNGFCSIEFVYGDRADTTSGYVKGFRQEANKRLARIDVKTGAYRNHAYNLTYQDSEQTGRSLLIAVDKQAADGSRVPATTFQWQSLLHGDKKWEEVGNLDFNEYGSGQDSGSGMASFISVSETDPTDVLLTGNAWRTYPLQPALTVTSTTYLRFDYMTSTVSPKWGMIGLDEDTLTASPKRLFKLVGGALPPVSAFNDNSWEYTTPGSWKTITIPVGQNYTGVMNYLALVNDDNTVNDGVGESRFKNIQVFQGNPASGGTLARTITFDQALASPQMMDGNNEDLGVRVQDLNGDGLPDIAYNLLFNKSSGNGAVTLETFGQALRNTGGDFVNDSTLRLPPTIPTANMPGGGEGQFANSQGIYGTPVDVNGDGQVEYLYAKNLVKESNGTFTCEHSYLTRENNAWVELPGYAHHFKSNCATSQKRFSHFEHIDLDSDGDLDVVVHPYGATLSLLAGKPNTTPATFPLAGNSGSNTGIAYLNKFREGEGWVAAPNWSLKRPLRIPGFSGGGGEVGRGLQDIDGDGRPDMYSALWQTDKDLWINSGSGWTEQPVQSPLAVPENITNSNGDDVGTRFVDVNGDGHVDVLKALGSGSMNLNKGVHLNTGKGWLSLDGTSVPWLPQENFNTVDKRGDMKEQGTSFADLNADGLVDFVVSKPSHEAVFLNTGKGWWADDSGVWWPQDSDNNGQPDALPGTFKPWKLPSPIYPNTTASTNGIRHAMLVDLNGDGISDLIADMKSPVPKIFINKATPERIISFTDGFGSDIQVNDYRCINDPVPVPNSLGLNRRVYDKTPVDSLSAGQVSVQDNRWVVARYSEPDGMGGRRYRSQYYQDLRFDKFNEASLGFGAVEVHDEVTKGYSVTYSHRQYPHSGSPVREEKFVKVTGSMTHQTGVGLGYHLISRELSKYDEKVSQTGIGGTIRRPVQIKSVGQKFDLDGRLMSVVVTDLPVSSYDAYGFVTSSTVVSLNTADLPLGINMLNPDAFDAAGSMVHKSVTSAAYKPITGTKWLPGRSTVTDVTLSRPGFTSLTKKTAYTYDDNGLLESETIQPGDDLYSTTVHLRDAYGNEKETRTTANVADANTSQTRVKLTPYKAETNFRFPDSEEVPGLGETKFHYDTERCLLSSTEDLNGRITTHTYDQFGTKIADNFPNHTRVADITRFASNADLPGEIRTILTTAGITIRWARVKEASGTPVATVFVDALGRDIVTRAAVLTSAAPSWVWQYQIKLFDAKGREYLSSNAFLGESSIRNPFTLGTSEWTLVEYDVLDRAIKTTHPDLTTVSRMIGTTTLTIDSLTSQPVAYVAVANQRSKDLERWLDAEGRLVQSRDASTQTTYFDHDLEGRVREVKIGNDWQLTNAYDIRGNRTMINDLSAGRTDSRYNGFGELWWTKNAKNEEVTTAYDACARVSSVTRPDDESSDPSVKIVFTSSYVITGANKGKLASVSNPKGYLEAFEYGGNDDDYGKLVRSIRRQKTGETTYDALTTYNALGLPLSEIDSGGLQIVHQYDSLYGTFRLKTVLNDPISTQVWKAPSIYRTTDPIDRTKDRMVSVEELSHGVIRTTKTDPANGRIREIFTTGLGRTLQDLAYTWDTIGNLTTRTDNLSTHPDGKIETFTYDDADRLKSSRIGNGAETTNSYLANGNLTGKDDGSLAYFPGSYRVETAKLKGASSNNRSYTYDVAGRVSSDGRRDYKWTAFGQLKEVKQMSAPALEKFAKTGSYSPQIPGIDSGVIYNASQALSIFEFDVAGARSKQTLKRTYVDGSYQEVITRYLGNHEIEDHATWNSSQGYVVNKSISRHRVGGALYTKEVQGSSVVTRLAVILTDHIGSTDVIVRGELGGASWKTTTSTDPALSESRSERQSYDAWGERRHGENWSELQVSDSSNRRTSAMDYDRGFTGHEMLDDFGLVHMNGRIYDPEIGRFLSPDPYVQVPEYSQNFNRYSYVLNNPLSYTDSSGNEVDGLVVAAVAIVVGIVTGGIATAAISAAYGSSTGALVATAATATASVELTAAGMALVGAVAGAFAGMASSALTGGNIAQGAFEGAVTGAITGGLLHGISPKGSLFTKSLTGTTRNVVHVAGHALVGGIKNELIGGRFQDGFLSGLAGAGSLYIPGLNKIMVAAGNRDPVGMFTRSMIAGVIGGTASALGGGKFANGAYTAAFQHLLNAEAPKADGGALIEIFRTAKNSTTSVLVYEDGQYLGGYPGNMDPDGSPDYGDKKDGSGATYQGPPDGTYKVLPKPLALYDNHPTEFMPGTPSITGPGRTVGSPAPGFRPTIRMHPYGNSQGCQTATWEWSNRLWDIVARNPQGSVVLKIHTVDYPKAIPVGPNLPLPSSHPWPPFTGHKNPVP